MNLEANEDAKLALRGDVDGLWWFRLPFGSQLTWWLRFRHVRHAVPCR